MIVTCPDCKTKFKLADDKVTPRGVKIRCSKCSNVFVVRQDSAESEAPPPAAEASGTRSRSQAAAQGGSDFSLDDFGAKEKEFGEGDPFGDFEFGDAPLGAGQPKAAPDRPDRPQRPAAGQAPPPRAPVKPGTPDNVFSDGTDLSKGRKMEVDIDSGGDFDNLDQLFAPDQKGAPPKPAAAPKPAPAAPKPAPKAPAPPAGGDPFADAPTLQTGGRGGAAEARGGGDAFGDLFGDQDSDAGSGLELEGEQSKAGGSDEFNTLLSGTDDFFGAGPPGKEEVLDFDAKGPGGGTEPTLQWGPRKNVKVEGGSSPVMKIVGAVLAVIALFVGWRASVEFVPQLYLDGGVPYETLIQLRGLVPFPMENPAFPKPSKFWEAQITKTFTIDNQFGKELYVVSGRVTNKGPGKRSFFAIEAQAADAAGQPIGLPEKVFAGNELDVEALKRLPLSQIREAFNVKFGSNGINFEVAPGTSLSFMIVFADWEKKPTQVQILDVTAIAAAS